MIRGVNRRVIEINEFRSEFFERAIFFVRSDASDTDDSALRNEADLIISSLGKPPAPKKRRKYRLSRKALWLFVWLSTGLAAVMTVLNVLH